MGKLFFKHFGALDNTYVDDVFHDALNYAVSKGLPTLEQKEKIILESGEWQESKDKRLVELTGFLSNLRLTKSKLFKQRERDAVDVQIQEADKEIVALESEKEKLIGLTAESYANKRVNEYYILNTLFSDEQLTKLKYSKEDFDELDNELLALIYKHHDRFSNRLSISNIKKISLAPFFMNLFVICDDNPMSLYGKPVVHLTFYQCQIFEYAKMFKNIITNAPTQPPEDVVSDPEKLMDWYESNKQAEKVLEKSGGKGHKDKVYEATSLVGASKEDLKRLGINTDNDPNSKAIKAAKKQGGSLGFEELMSLQGL